MKRTLAFAISAQAVSIVLLLILAFQFFKQSNALSEYSARVEHTYLVINQLAHVESLIKDAETSSRGFLLTNQPQFLDLLNKSKIDILPSIDSLRRLLIDNKTQLLYLKEVQKLAYEKMWTQIESARMKHYVSNDSLLSRLLYGRQVMEKLEWNMDKMKETELELLHDRRKIKRKYELLLPRNVRVVFFIAGFSTLFFGLWIFVELRKRFRFQGLLQQKLMELRQNNEELEQIAFAASHDLQEPLRKIRIFSDRLLLKTNDNPDDDNYMMTKRINLAASRLQDLISDLVVFNNLVQNKFSISTVSLKKIIQNSVDAALKKLPEMNIEIYEDSLPDIIASKDQVTILFQQLFNNSLQFKSPGRDLSIKINCQKIKWSQIKGLPSEITEGYFYHLKMIDNGVGFDESYKSKMFKPFQRLHNYDNETSKRRKGMGLAMCKRVMLNLGGWIDAEGREGEGAIIHLYFPAT